MLVKFKQRVCIQRLFWELVHADVSIQSQWEPFRSFMAHGSCLIVVVSVVLAVEEVLEVCYQHCYLEVALAHQRSCVSMVIKELELELIVTRLKLLTVIGLRLWVTKDSILLDQELY